MARFLVLTETDDEGLPDLLKTTGVIGVYRAPTVFCEGNHSGGKFSEGFTKGTRYGWWVCTTCHKPKKLYWTNIIQDSGFGRNVLKDYL